LSTPLVAGFLRLAICLIQANKTYGAGERYTSNNGSGATEQLNPPGCMCAVKAILLPRQLHNDQIGSSLSNNKEN